MQLYYCYTFAWLFSVSISVRLPLFDNLNDCLKHLCLVSRVAVTLRVLTRNLLTYLLTDLRVWIISVHWLTAWSVLTYSARYCSANVGTNISSCCHVCTTYCMVTHFILLHRLCCLLQVWQAAWLKRDNGV